MPLYRYRNSVSGEWEVFADPARQELLAHDTDPTKALDAAQSLLKRRQQKDAAEREKQLKIHRAELENKVDNLLRESRRMFLRALRTHSTRFTLDVASWEAARKESDDKNLAYLQRRQDWMLQRFVMPNVRRRLGKFLFQSSVMRKLATSHIEYGEKSDYEQTGSASISIAYFAAALVGDACKIPFASEVDWRAWRRYELDYERERENVIQEAELALSRLAGNLNDHLASKTRGLLWEIKHSPEPLSRLSTQWEEDNGPPPSIFDYNPAVISTTGGRGDSIGVLRGALARKYAQFVPRSEPYKFGLIASLVNLLAISYWENIKVTPQYVRRALEKKDSTPS